jgi:ElaB/YqjD/DUF883 family membrane-anchored ribosome-binding protein
MRKEVPVVGEDIKNARLDYLSSNGSTSVLGLRQELANLKEDLDALMSHASTLTESELCEARDRLMARFSSMKNVARGIAGQATRQLAQSRDVTIEFIRERPFQSALIAAGKAFVFTMIRTIFNIPSLKNKSLTIYFSMSIRLMVLRHMKYR